MNRNSKFDIIIKTHFKKFKKITKSSLNKFFSSNCQIKDYVSSFIDEYVQSEQQAILIILNDITLKKCKTCGKQMTYVQTMNNDFCSVKCAANNEDTLKKTEKTNLNRYGFKNVFESDVIKEKIKTILIDRFGVDNVQKNSYIHDKTVKTVKERYRVNNSFNVNNVDKAFKMFDSWKEYVIPMFTKEDYADHQKKEFKWKCLKCGNEFHQKLYSTNHLKNISQEIPRCWKCFPRNTSFSIKEAELRDFCKNYFNDVKFNDVEFLNGLELDIVIPSIRLALEFNGCYWHSVKNGHGNGYHLNKTLKCNEKDYRLIHIWEDEWDCGKENIKAKLENAFLGNEAFSEEELNLDRSWFNNVNVYGYVLKEEIPPEIISRYGNDVENCGYLKYFRKLI